MRILVLCRDVVPPRGGTGAPPWAVACALASSGHRVHVLAAEPAIAPPPAPGVTLETVAEYPPLVDPSDRLGWALALNLAMFERAAGAIMRDGADAVHADGWETAYVATMIRHRFETPLVAAIRYASQIRDTDPEVAVLAAQAQRWLAAEAQRVIVPSPAAARAAHADGLDPSVVRIVPAAAGSSDAARTRTLARRIAPLYDEAVAQAARRQARDTRAALRALFERSSA